MQAGASSGIVEPVRGILLCYTSVLCPAVTRRIWHILGLVIARIYNDLDNQIIGDLHCSRAQVNVINPRSRWDLFFLIYTFMVLVELDVGNIMPYVIREAPSTTSFCHDDSMLILLFPSRYDINPEKVDYADRFESCNTLHKVTFYEAGN